MAELPKVQNKIFNSSSSAYQNTLTSELLIFF